ncbi:hypothetical protein NMY22_g12926 [Coprinellus aureogranulatus]|nr:hypothetical protein NMY22_g12926 [Coprinellus aureogranulatus]
MSLPHRAPPKSNPQSKKIASGRPPTHADVRTLRKKVDNLDYQAAPRRPRKLEDKAGGDASDPESVASGLFAGDTDDSFRHMGSRTHCAVHEHCGALTSDNETAGYDMEPETSFEDPGSSANSHAPPVPPQAPRAFLTPAVALKRSTRQQGAQAQAQSSTGTTLPAPDVPVVMKVVMLTGSQVPGYLEDVVGDNDYTLLVIDSLRSVIMHSDIPAHFEELGRVVQVDIRDAVHPVAPHPTQGQTSSSDANAEVPPVTFHEAHPSIPAATTNNATATTVRQGATVAATLIVVYISSIVRTYPPSLRAKLVGLRTGFFQGTTLHHLSHAMDSLTWVPRLNPKVIEGLAVASRWALVPLVHASGFIRQVRISLTRYIQRAVQRLVVLMLAWLEGLLDKLAFELPGLTLPPAPPAA